MRKRVIFKWLIFVVLIATIASMTPAALGRIYLIKGQRQFHFGRYQEAIGDYQKAIRLSPNYARAYVELGDSYRQLARYAEAEDAFKKAVRLDDESCASCGLGMTYYKLGRVEEAEQAFKRSISLDPNDVCGHEQSGHMYYDLRRYRESIAAFTQATRLHPSASAYLYLGSSYFSSGQFAEAADAYTKATLLQSDEEDAYVRLGFAYDRLRRPDEAVHAYQLAIKLKPADERPHCGLIKIYLDKGQTQLARAEIEILRTLDPKLAAEIDQRAPALQTRKKARSQISPLNEF